MCNYFEFWPLVQEEILYKVVFLILALSWEQNHLTQNYDDLCEINLNLDQQFRKHHVGAQWLSGRVLDSRPSGGGGFEPHQRHCVVSLSKTHLS